MPRPGPEQKPGGETQVSHVVGWDPAPGALTHFALLHTRMVAASWNCRRSRRKPLRGSKLNTLVFFLFSTQLSLLYTCRPSPRQFRASNSNFFLLVLLIGLFGDYTPGSQHDTVTTMCFLPRFLLLSLFLFWVRGHHGFPGHEERLLKMLCSHEHLARRYAHTDVTASQ